jgi:putative glycerol-1-phosphate prenyltransferase
MPSIEANNFHLPEPGSVETHFREVVREKGAAFCLLLDPDRNTADELSRAAEIGQKGGVDFIFIGSSLMLSGNFDEGVKAVKKGIDLPVVVFPGNPGQISDQADAILFLSLISGRNAEYIIGQQVVAAPRIHELGLEAIPTGYMLIDSGGITSAQYMSMTAPMPRDKPDIAVAHALAARFMGMRFIYLEGGSGGELAVPEVIINEVASTARLPVIVGGGIRTADDARSRVEADASAIVIGNSLEGIWSEEKIREFAEAVHQD